MASINKLSIRGVRSFSPEDDEQVLEFYHPLTVIVGANGCGKTTIIECLRFAVAGALPPGNKGGQTFVHDPRSIGTSVVKANVKLRFTNCAENNMVVVRSMEVTQKKTSMAFKQLDGVLRATDENGQRQAMSHKCTELDRQIPLFLGVTKPILEHVIFCHQEDSSWPLQEGAVLKKKFDEIFDSQRYTKALDVFAKLRKEYAATAKELKAEVASLKSHRHAAHQFQRELRDENEKIETVEDELLSIRQDLRVNEEEMNRVEGIIKEVGDYICEESELGQTISTKMSVIDQQKKMLEEDLTDNCSMQDLNDRLREFDGGVDSIRREKTELEHKMTTLASEIEFSRKKISEIQSDIGRIQAEKKNHERNLVIRFNRMVEIGQSFGLEDLVTQISQNSQLKHSTQSQNMSYLSQNASVAESTVTMSQMGDEEAITAISQADMDAFWNAVHRKKDELENDLTEKKAKRSSEEDETAKELAHLMGKQQSLLNEQKQLNEQDRELRAELDRLKKHEKSKTRKTDLEDAKKAAAVAAKNRDEANKNPRKQAIPAEIKHYQNKVDELTQEIAKEKVVIEELRKQGDKQNAIKIIREQCETDLENLMYDFDNRDKLGMKVCQLDNLPTQLPTTENDVDGKKLEELFEDIFRKIEEVKKEKEAEVEKLQSEHLEIDQRIKMNAAVVKSDEDTVNMKRGNLARTNQSYNTAKRIFNDIRTYAKTKRIPFSANLTPDAPDQLMKHIEEQIEELEEQSTSLEGVSPEVIKKVFKLLSKKSAQANMCLCCNRPIENNSPELKTFKEGVAALAGSSKRPSILLDDDNSEINDIRDMLAQYQEWRDTLKPLVPILMSRGGIVQEIDELEKKVSTNIRKIDHDKELKNAKKIDLDSAEGELRTVDESFNSSKEWKFSATKISQNRRKARSDENDLKDELMSDKSGRTLDEVESHMEKLQLEKEESNNKQIRLNQELAELVETTTGLAEVASRKERLAQNMAMKYEEELKATETRKQIEEQVEGIYDKKKKINNDIEPLKNRIKDRESKRDSMRRLLVEEEENTSRVLSDFNEKVKSVKQIVDQIKDFEVQAESGDGDRLEKKSADLEQQIKTKQEQYRALKPDLDKITKDVNDQERQKKNLLQNIELLEAQQEVERISNNLKVLTQKRLRIDGGDTCEDDKRALEKRFQELSERKASLKGKRNQMKETMMGLKRKLSQKEYKDVDEEYRQECIKFDTTEMAVKDVDRYRAALDKALQEFHRKKINDINNIIKELWNLTYKGEDITGIKIVSGADSNSRATKSYNYRVVMTKGSTEMDMRGRCSAGQRVLASIVIRLALAQTFCLKCGCIALDEPTVNLDHVNKSGLAVALAQIIQDRSTQSNFQLILITHDEDFVHTLNTELSSLARVSMPEFYHQVRREEGADGKFYSKIERCDWEGSM